MKKHYTFKAILIVTVLLLSGRIFAQGWSVNPSDYANTGTITAVVTLNTVEFSAGTLGAFVGTECRGVTDVISFFPPSGHWVITLMVYSNTSSGETMTFKFYDSGSGITYDINETQAFTSDMIVGSAMVPLVLTAISTGNNAPTLDNPVSDQSLTEGFGSTSIDISSVFSDPDGDALSYSVSSGNTGVVNASLSGTTLTITEVGTGTSTITLSASDGSISTDDTFDVTVTASNQSPVLDNPISDVSYNEGFGSAVIDLSGVFSDPDSDPLTLTAASSNTSVVTVAVSGTTLTITEVGIGSSTITVTASDGSLSISDNFSVTVSDITDPVISICAADRTLEVASNCLVSIPDLTGEISASDNHDTSLDITQSPLAGSTAGTGITQVTISVSDDAGNTANCTVDLTIIDNTDPTITAPASISVPCDAGICTASGVSLGTPTSADNCSVASVSNNAPATFPLGATTVTWTVSDGSGNSTTATQTVTVYDNQNPSISAPADIAVLADAGLCTASSVSLGSPVTSDNCSVANTTNNAPATFPIGVTTVTWTVTDGSGNTASATQSVVVSENIDPTITAPANVSVSTDAGQCTASGVNLGTPTTNDNCSVASVTNNAPSVFQLGATTITWTVTDGSGNTATATQTVTVSDNENPGITAPAAVAVSTSTGVCTASSVSLGSAVTSDNCTVASVTNNAPATFPLGITTVTWTVTDASGNSATATQSVVVTDDEDPTITAPASVAVSADAGICTASGVALGSATVSDNCSVASTSNNAPSIFPLGATTVTWTVIDGSGNSATATQTVTVTDNQDPTITAPGDLNVSTDAGTCSASSVSLGSPTTADNCSVASTTNNAPATFPLGLTTVTWTVTDGSGNTASATQDIIVTDDVDPSITAPANLIVSTDAGLCTASGISLGSALSSDNCSVASVSNNAPTTYPLGSTTITWTVTDAAGNSATALQTVTVVDDINPTISAPAAVSVSVDAGVCTASSVSLGSPVAGDNCTVASVTNNAPATFPLGITTVTWTVTDASGNSATSTQTVTVTDDEDPVIVNCAPGRSINGNINNQALIPDLVSEVNAFDNCGVASITQNPAAGTTAGIGTTTVVITVTDNSGNAVTCNCDVEVIDVNFAPVVVNALADISLDEGFGTHNIDLSGVFSDPDGDALTISVGSSNTSVVTIVLSGTNLQITEVGMGTSTITVTAKDGSLSTSDTFIISVDNVNETPTVLNPVADQSINEGFVSTTINLSGTFSDPDGDALTLSASSSNTGVVTVSVSETTLTVTEVSTGTSTITLTASDGSLSVSDNFEFEVVHVNLAPLVENPISDVTYTEGFSTADIDLASVFSDPEGDNLTLSVLSGNTLVVTTSISGTILTISEVGLGSSTVTVSASDGFLSVSDEFSVTVSASNRAPLVANEPADVSYDEGWTSSSIDLSNVFEDPDQDPLTLSVSNTNNDVVTVSLSGTTLTLTEVGNGMSTVTVSASDGSLSASTDFTVTVTNVNEAPVVANPVADITLEEGFATHVIQISSVFSDPDGDQLSYTVESNKESVVTVSLSGTELTITEADTGSATITLTASDGALSVVEEFIVKVNGDVGITNSIFNTISVYPVPSEGIVYLKAEYNSDELLTIEVINSIGQLIEQRKSENTGKDLMERFDLSTYDAGLYFIRLTNNEVNEIIKIVIK